MQSSGRFIRGALREDDAGMRSRRHRSVEISTRHAGTLIVAQRAWENGGRGDRARILVVEDDLEVASLAMEALAGFGYEVRHAEDASQALRLLAETPGPDLVFSDIVMPGMSGVELASLVRERWPGVPVLLATGYNPRTFPAIPADVPVLAKPYPLRELAGRVASLLGARSNG